MKAENPSLLQFSGRRLLSVPEAAKYLGISPKTIYNRIHPKAKIPFPVKPKRAGRRVLFDVRDLESYVDSL
jgi:excisionase family DNA binding protein